MHPSSRRRAAGLYLASTLAACAAAPGSAQNGPAKDDYFPLRKGHEWHRREQVSGVTVDEYRAEVVAVETVDGLTRARLLFHHSPTLVGKATSWADDRGVYNDASYGKVQLLKYPVKVGEVWSERFGPGPDGRAAVEITHEVAAKTVVEVPAGKFDVIEVRAVRTTQGVKFTNTLWLANGVGLVKEVRAVDHPDGKHQTVVAELLRFTPGK
jgi:hypothetical protein